MCYSGASRWIRDQPTTEKEINSNLTYDPTLAVTRVRITRFDGRRLATLTCFDIVVGCVCSREPSSEFSLILSSATMVHAPQVALKVCCLLACVDDILIFHNWRHTRQPLESED